MKYWKFFGMALFCASTALIALSVGGAINADPKDQAGWLQAAGAILAMAAALWISRDDALRKRDGELQIGEIALLGILPNIEPAKLALSRAIAVAEKLVAAQAGPGGVVMFVDQYRELAFSIGVIELPTEEQQLRLAPLDREIALSTARYVVCVKIARRVCETTLLRASGNGCTHATLQKETGLIVEKLQDARRYLDVSFASAIDFLSERRMPELKSPTY